MMTFSLVVILLTLLASVANSRPVVSLERLGMLTDTHLAHIFKFKNQDGILMIDFDIIKDAIQSVNVLKNGEIVRDEDVSEIPGDSVFELDLNKLNKGNYVIELVTNTHRITKEIAIN